jgi:hypothetical protein
VVPQPDETRLAVPKAEITAPTRAAAPSRWPVV